jgi:hypothetical protein
MLTSLPDEILAEVETYLDYPDALVYARHVSKQISNTIEQLDLKAFICPACRKLHKVWCRFYKFQLYPETYQPSGHINLSNINLCGLPLVEGEARGPALSVPLRFFLGIQPYEYEPNAAHRA